MCSFKWSWSLHEIQDNKRFNHGLWLQMLTISWPLGIFIIRIIVNQDNLRCPLMTDLMHSPVSVSWVVLRYLRLSARLAHCIPDEWMVWIQYEKPRKGDKVTINLWLIICARPCNLGLLLLFFTKEKACVPSVVQWNICFLTKCNVEVIEVQFSPIFIFILKF